MADFFAIKVRRNRARAWRFLASVSGDTNRLKVHALRHPSREDAQVIVDLSAQANPGTEWKVVPLEARANG